MPLPVQATELYGYIYYDVTMYFISLSSSSCRRACPKFWAVKVTSHACPNSGQLGRGGHSGGHNSGGQLGRVPIYILGYSHAYHECILLYKVSVLLTANDFTKQTTCTYSYSYSYCMASRSRYK